MATIAMETINVQGGENGCSVSPLSPPSAFPFRGNVSAQITYIYMHVCICNAGMTRMKECQRIKDVNQGEPH